MFQLCHFIVAGREFQKQTLAEICGRTWISSGLFSTAEERENGFLLVLSPPRLNYSPNRVHSTQININYADKKKKKHVCAFEWRELK